MGNQFNDALPIGTLLNSGKRTYKIVEVLGAGGFGITYKVSSEIMVDNVPIVTCFCLKEHFVKKVCERRDSKVYSSANSCGDIENSKQNFLSEAERLNKLSASHDNIVKVNEYFTANDTAYYVMEFIDGPSLRDMVKAQGNRPLKWELALSMIMPIAEAVSYLHSHRLTHLDIKPDNIIIDSKKGNRPVLIDFGLSKHYDKKGEATSTIRVTGCSDGYSPIEQYVGITSFSPKADVYALAATLLYLLTGKDPKIATELNADRIRENLGASVPDYVVEALLKGLKRQPEDRMESVEQFIKSLKHESSATIEDSPTVPLNTDGKTVKIEPSRKNKISRRTIGIISSCFAALFLTAFAVYSLSSHEPYERMADGSKFFGTLNPEGLPNGEGRMVCSNGDTISGIWDNGYLTTGSINTPQYEYSGQIRDNVPFGYGVASYRDGRIYTGHWTGGKWNGLGKLDMPDGNISFGNFENGKLVNQQPFTVGEEVYGIDVSRWQKQIDWENLFLSASRHGKVSVDGGEYMQPALFAFLKATDGQDEDAWFERNYHGVRRCGIIYGAYHFLTTKCSVDTQVEKFISVAKLTKGDLPPVLDLELPNEVMKDRKKEVCEIALEWLEKIEKHYGVRPIIYTYEYFIIDYLSDPRFDKYEYWVAKHRNEPPTVKHWKFWQFTDKCKVPGILHNTTDIEIFNGDFRKFQDYIRQKGIK